MAQITDLYKIEVDLSNLSENNLCYDNPFILSVLIESVRYEFYISIKNSNNLFIFGNGAYNYEKILLPVFQRYTWADELSESVIIYNDPTLYFGKISLGWGQGTQERFYLKEISVILEKIISILNVERSKVVFYGSSAGGFMSLYLAGLLKETRALVNNPQIVVPNYYERHVKNMYKCSYKGLTPNQILDNYKNRLDINVFYKSINYIPDILYLQNIACSHDVKNHLTPFINETINSNFLQNNKVRFELYSNNEQGHNPLDKATTFSYFKKFIQ